MKKYKSPFERQIGELITRSSASIRVNSEAEWRFNALPRASVSWPPRELYLGCRKRRESKRKSLKARLEKKNEKIRKIS